MALIVHGIQRKRQGIPFSVTAVNQTARFGAGIAGSFLLLVVLMQIPIRLADAKIEAKLRMMTHQGRFMASEQGKEWPGYFDEKP